MFIIHIRRGQRLGDRQRDRQRDRVTERCMEERGREVEKMERGREIDIEDCEGEKEM